MRDAYIHIRINRNTSIAVVVSLLLHLLALYLLSRQDLLNQSASEKPQAITVQLSPHKAQKLAEAAPAASVTPSPPVALPREVRKAKPQPSPAPYPETPNVVAVPRPEPATMPSPTAQRNPAPAKSAPLDPAQFPDMASYLSVVRERRRLAGDAAQLNEDAAAQARSVAENEARQANLERNPQPPGTNGVFTILSMDTHTATFAFRGWKNEFSYSQREVYQVDAGLNGNVAREMVRKMIEIIRRYYSGDFNWDSHRMGRVVVLSARMQDNDGLEDFLMQDFFGTRGITAQ